jgi:hypothetical protein
VRKSNIYLLYIAANLVLVGLMFVHASYTQESNEPHLLEKSDMVKRFELTDLCLFTDARYTRNPSLADRHSAFQDTPMSFDHFPSGSVMPPPPHLVNRVTH